MKDGLYHITSRGNEGKAIFLERGDRLKFLDILADYHVRFGILIHAYVLMDTHYHLILGTPRGNLLKVMHGLNSGYTGYFNRKNKRKGHLFQGRYKGILVEKETYLLPLSRYIHLNPYRAGLVKKPEQYEWSSYPAYIGKAGRAKWIYPGWVLAPFDGGGKGAGRKYRQYVEDGMGVAEPFLPKVFGQIVLGGDGFVETVKDMVKRKVLSREIVERKKLQEGISLEKVGQVVTDAFRIKEEEILGKGTRGNFPRQAALYLAKRLTGKGNREIGEFFGGIQASAVSKAAARVEKEMSRNWSVRNQMERLKSYFKA
jgi:REP element-mobilizing transposase RayT